MIRQLLFRVLRNRDDDVARQLLAPKEDDMSDHGSPDAEIARLTALYSAALRRFESGEWLDDLPPRAKDYARAAKLLFEQERLRVDTLRVDLTIATERRKFDLRVALRTQPDPQYNTELWDVRTRTLVEYDADALRRDFPDLPDSVIKTKHTVVRRKLPPQVEAALPRYELTRNVSYTVSLRGQGSDDDDAE